VELLSADGITVVGLLLATVAAFALGWVVPGYMYKKVLQERDEAVAGRLEDAKEYQELAKALIRAKEKETDL
jgi:hypothetical protein